MNSPTLNIDTERGVYPSASGFEAYAGCANRHQAVLKYPKPQTNSEAQHGNEIHEHLEAWFGGGTHGIIKEEHQRTFDLCRNLAQSTIDGWTGDQKYTLKCEERLWSSKWGENNEYCFSGKTDLVATRDDGAVLILDFKTLYGDYPASPDNLQLRAQAVLYWMVYGSNNICVGIVQPLVSKEVVLTRYTEASLHSAIAQIQLITETVIDGGDATAGNPQCNYCPAKAECTAYQDWIRQELPVELKELPLTNKWTPEQWITFIAKEKEVRDWITAKKDELKALLEANPDAVSGLGLSNPTTTNTIISVPKAYANLNDAIGRDQFFEACSVSISDLSDAIAKATDCSKEKAKKFILERNVDNIQQTEGARRIVKRK